MVQRLQCLQRFHFLYGASRIIGGDEFQGDGPVFAAGLPDFGKSTPSPNLDHLEARK